MSKMAQLRAYYYNHGDMLELVRYQKKKESITEEKEEIIYSSSDLWKEERKHKKSLGCFADMVTYSIPYIQIKKIANFRHQILGL